MLQGERTPNRPLASATLHGLTINNYNRRNVARSMVEGMMVMLLLLFLFCYYSQTLII